MKNKPVLASDQNIWPLGHPAEFWEAEILSIYFNQLKNKELFFW